MSYQKDFKEEMSGKLDKETPHLEQYEKKSSSSSPRRREISSLKKWLIGGGALLASASLVGGLVIGLYRPRPNSLSLNLEAHRLVAPDERQVETDYGKSTEEGAISSTTSQIYKSFIANFVPYVFAGGSSSASFSVVDAFVNLAALTYISSAECQAEMLPLFGNPSTEELNQAAKEILLALATPRQNKTESQGSYYTGGYGLNSLWLNSNLTLEEGASSYLATLKDYYYMSVYHMAPTATDLNNWFKDSVPSDYPEIPQVDFGEEDTKFDITLVSSYFLFEKFLDNSVQLEKAYKEGSDLMSYTLPDGSQKMTDAILSDNSEKIYSGQDSKGKGFKGAKGSLNISYFLPDENTSDPVDIIPSLAKGQVTVSSDLYHVSCYQPYFKIVNKGLDLTGALKKNNVSAIFSHGSCSNLVKEDCALVFCRQFSEVTFDYKGLYSASITVSGNDVTSVPADQPFLLKLDRPYAFRADCPCKVSTDGNISFDNLPVLFGAVVDPNYPTSAA